MQLTDLLSANGKDFLLLDGKNSTQLKNPASGANYYPTGARGVEMRYDGASFNPVVFIQYGDKQERVWVKIPRRILEVIDSLPQKDIALTGVVLVPTKDNFFLLDVDSSPNMETVPAWKTEFSSSEGVHLRKMNITIPGRGTPPAIVNYRAGSPFPNWKVKTEIGGKYQTRVDGAPIDSDSVLDAIYTMSKSPFYMGVYKGITEEIIAARLNALEAAYTQACNYVDEDVEDGFSDLLLEDILKLFCTKNQDVV